MLHSRSSRSTGGLPGRWVKGLCIVTYLTAGFHCAVLATFVHHSILASSCFLDVASGLDSDAPSAMASASTQAEYCVRHAGLELLAQVMPCVLPRLLVVNVRESVMTSRTESLMEDRSSSATRSSFGAPGCSGRGSAPCRRYRRLYCLGPPVRASLTYHASTYAQQWLQSGAHIRYYCRPGADGCWSPRHRSIVADESVVDLSHPLEDAVRTVQNRGWM